ncbi:MAG: O-antigen polymerase [Gammaproteobacteria bacterium]|nr:MAG: O-antigen polymerase [Gammaproteobacteria bacterium]TND05845.1 MAG: O-antigen polymerase [Gammaproteobacteria bacterium]
MVAIAEPVTGAVWKERLILSLLFLFPLAGACVKHWLGTIFTVLFLIGLWDLVRGRGRPPLFTAERVWLSLCVAFLLSFFLSAVINGWSEDQRHALGVEIRYLALVPLYLLVRRYPRGALYLLSGSVFAAFVMAVQSYYDVFSLMKERAEGAYSPNLLGPLAALSVMFAVSIWALLPRLRWMILAAVPAGLWSVAMSGSRGAYFGLIAMGMVWALLYFRRWQRPVMLVVVLLIPVTAYLSVGAVQQRVDGAVHDVAEYFSHTRSENQTDGAETAAIRFEMWRAALLVFRDAPVFGIGTRNYTQGVQKYVDSGQVNPAAAHHGHPHDAYFDVLMSRGLTGFVIFLGVLFYPLYYFLKTFQRSPHSAMAGILLITGFAMFSVTDASTFNKGNFLSFYLLFQAVLLSWHAGQVHREAG